MKNFELEKMYVSLFNISGSDDELPVSVGYKIAYNRNLVENAIKPYWETHDKIVQKYGKGKPITKENENYLKCTKELEELSNEDAGDLKFKTVKLEDLEGIKLPMKTITDLMFMIEDGD